MASVFTGFVVLKNVQLTTKRKQVTKQLTINN